MLTNNSVSAFFIYFWMMKFNWVKTHWLTKKIFSKYVWDIPNNEKKVYLTFDDGPTPEITNWVLNVLKQYNSKATFFCIGKNIQQNPEIFKKIILGKHSVGNHTFNHLNGWKTSTKKYIENVELCQTKPQIPTIYNLKPTTYTLFRPPYGKIKPSQSKKLRKLGYKIIMWDVLSVDYDQNILKEKCLENVINNVQSGSIIVFHDSQKAFKNLEYVLPKTLEYLNKVGLVCAKIE